MSKGISLLWLCLSAETITIAIDGLFGLCRKKATGASVQDPLSDSIMLESQSEVNAFVDGPAMQRPHHQRYMHYVNVYECDTVRISNFRDATIFWLVIRFNQKQDLRPWMRQDDIIL